MNPTNGRRPALLDPNIPIIGQRKDVTVLEWFPTFMLQCLCAAGTPLLAAGIHGTVSCKACGHVYRVDEILFRRAPDGQSFEGSINVRTVGTMAPASETADAPAAPTEPAAQPAPEGTEP
jgi:hypothetical protein